MTEEEIEELRRLQRLDDLCSLGDRPMSMAASKLRRLMELEHKARQDKKPWDQQIEQ